MTTRLAPADALALSTQTSTTPAHTVSVVVLDASAQLGHDMLARHVAATIPRLARFRSRLVDKPFGMGQPIWAEIANFDPAARIHRARVPRPGGERELADLITQLDGRPVSRGGPLWEAWTIDGLAGGRWAVAVRMSPVLAQGGPGVAVLWESALTRTRTTDNSPAEFGLGPAPSIGVLVADMLSEIVENQITGAWLAADAVTAVVSAARGRLQNVLPPARLAHAVSSMRGPVPRTVFNAPLTRRRSHAFVSTRRADVEIVSDAFGGSAENVLLAACTLALRSWLQRHDVMPDEPLVMAVAEGWVRVPVQVDDPVQVLTNMHTATERATLADEQSDGTDRDADAFTNVMSMLWPWAARAGMQMYNGLGLAQRSGPRCHGRVSFVAGSSETLRGAGAEVVGIYTAEPLVEGSGLNIVVTSHADTMSVCVTACPDNVPFVDDIARGVAEAVEVLVVAARRSPRGYGRSVVTEMMSHSSKRG
jgi:diacylglycerol O-acyltransferase